MSKISALGYLVVRDPADQWRDFGTQALGGQLAESSTEPGRVRLRTDERAWRIEVQDGPSEPERADLSVLPGGTSLAKERKVTA